MSVTTDPACDDKTGNLTENTPEPTDPCVLQESVEPGGQRPSAALQVRLAEITDWREAQVAWFATRAKLPKFHLVRECDGLSAVPEEYVETAEFSSAVDVLYDMSGRPCRMCSFEPLLSATSSKLTGKSHPVLTEFSGQPNPKETNPFRYEWRTVSDSGAERLRRLARTLGVGVVDTVAGPVAFGYLPEAVGSVLARNLRTIVCPTAGHDPSRFEVEVRWALLSETPPERDVECQIDAWTAARAIVAPVTRR